MSAVIKGASYALFHVPDLVQYGSKPTRDIQAGLATAGDLRASLRGFQEMLTYAPNQVFVGNADPSSLHDVPRPWYEHPVAGAPKGRFGGIVPQIGLYAWLALVDQFDLVWYTHAFWEDILQEAGSLRFLGPSGLGGLTPGRDRSDIVRAVLEGRAIPLEVGGTLIGSVRQDHELDDTLKPRVLLENLAAKATGSWAMRGLFEQTGIEPTDVDYVMDCTETAIGDRYNRGGGSLSKAMAETCGCLNASGCDVRAFCCGPNHALVIAAALVEAGLFRNVVVAGGGCLAKLGMKFAAHLKHGMPVLEDALAGMAFLVTRDDGQSPIVRLDSVGKHDVGAGSSQQSIMTNLISKPLERLGWGFEDIDRYATELHNPEITLPAGSGDTPATNYRILASLAVMRGDIDRSAIPDFILRHGMLGYAPTQGHIPSAVPYIGHAIESMRAGTMRRSMFIGKGSIFLGRMSRLSDGISFVLERNHSA